MGKNTPLKIANCVKFITFQKEYVLQTHTQLHSLKNTNKMSIHILHSRIKR